MIQLPNDFKEFLRLLNENRVRYLLIGGYAVAYHGHPRSTGDIDIWVEIALENARRITDTLQQFGFSPAGLSFELFLERNRIIRLGFPPLRIELTTSISGVEFEECYAGRVVDELDGVMVNIINFEHLLANKAASGRHKDLADLEQLRDLS